MFENGVLRGGGEVFGPKRGKVDRRVEKAV
jgi:hypothetical protein